MNIKTATSDFNLLETILHSPHTLIAGTTGSGKSVLLNYVLHGLLNEDTDAGLYLVDTKRVELAPFAKYDACVDRITEPEDAPALLDACVKNMDRIYRTMEATGAKESNTRHYFVVIDELADLLSSNDDVSKQCLKSIVKIGRLGRAAHIHLLCCTQDPSRNTLTAQLMQNFTTCIALRCKTEIESRQIIGIDDAKRLPKYGKAILSNADGYTLFDVPMIIEDDTNNPGCELSENYVEQGVEEQIEKQVAKEIKDDNWRNGWILFFAGPIVVVIVLAIFGVHGILMKVFELLAASAIVVFLAMILISPVVWFFKSIIEIILNKGSHADPDEYKLK